MFIIISSIILLWLVAMGAQFHCDSLLLNKFTDIDIEQYEVLNNSRNFELRLLNLKFRSFLLPSYKGVYSSIVLPDTFNLNINEELILLSTNSSAGEQRKYKQVHKQDCKIKKDIFAGNLLVIKIDEFTLTFKTPRNFDFLGLSG